MEKGSTRLHCMLLFFFLQIKNGCVRTTTLFAFIFCCCCHFVFIFILWKPKQHWNVMQQKRARCVIFSLTEKTFGLCLRDGKILMCTVVFWFIRYKNLFKKLDVSLLLLDSVLCTLLVLCILNHGVCLHLFVIQREKGHSTEG